MSVIDSPAQQTFTHLLPLDAPTTARAFAAEARAAGFDVESRFDADRGEWLVHCDSFEDRKVLQASIFTDSSDGPAVFFLTDEVERDRVASLGEVRTFLKERIEERKVDNSPCWYGTVGGVLVDINGREVA